MSVQQADSLSPSECQKESVDTIVYASLPLGLLISALVCLACHHRQNRRKTIPSPLITRKWPFTNIHIQIALVVTKTLWGGYLLLSGFETCRPLSQIARLMTCLGLLVMLATSPPVDSYKAKHHISSLAVVYTAAFLEALHSTFALPDSRMEQYRVFIDLTFSTLLLILAYTTPYPLNPENVATFDNSEVEVKQNWVYRDGRPLIPEATASLFSWMTFQWMDAFILAGYKQAPTFKDIYAMSCDLLSRPIYAEFDKSRNASCRKIWQQIYLANWVSFWANILAAGVGLGLGLLDIFFRQQFIRYVENPDGQPISIAYGFALGLFLTNVATCISRTVRRYADRVLRLRIISMLNVAIYDKTLRRKDMSGKVEKSEEKKEEEGDGEKTDEESPSTSKNGKIVNLMSNDTRQIANIASCFDQYLFFPFDIGFTILYLYNVLGVAALIGCSFTVLLLPTNWLFARKISKIYDKVYQTEDKRINLVSELLHGIRLIKYFAWEAGWRNKVLQVRKAELKLFFQSCLCNVLMNAFVSAVPPLVSIISFVWFTKVDGKELTASVALISISLFDRLEGPLVMGSAVASKMSEGRICLRRISDFLDEPEVSSEVDEERTKVPEGKTPEDALARVGFETSEFKWHAAPSETLCAAGMVDDHSFRVFVPAFDFPTGCLSIVCGPTGSGKTSFLNALLGEMDIVSGRVYNPSKCRIDLPITRIDPYYPDLYLDRVAYVGQRPFLQHETIRNNILFGEPYDPIRYKKVILQCALAADFSIWPDQDLTEIGEKGITLSGGQKQRVSLARAVYSRAKTVLLDDCLSAVDSHTARHIFEKCIHGDLMTGRTVILTTHHVQLCLPKAKFLVKMDGGRVVWHGLTEKAAETEELANLAKESAQTDQGETEEVVQTDFEIPDSKGAPSKKLIEDEDVAQGSVSINSYIYYLESCGSWFFWITVTLIIILIHGTWLSQSWWLRKWALAYEAVHDSISVLFSHTATTVTSMAPKISSIMTSWARIQAPSKDTFSTIHNGMDQQALIQSMVYREETSQNIDLNYYIFGYAFLCVILVIFEAAESILITLGSLRASRKIFETLLNRVTTASMRFFDTTPVGRIMNRFSKDIDAVDYYMEYDTNNILRTIVGIVITTLVVSSITPEFIIIGIIAGIINIGIGSLFLTISRELERINSVHMSPIYSLYSESLDGITTIRAYMQQERFMSMVYAMQDTYMAPSYLLYAAHRWLSIRFDLSSAILTLSATIFILRRIDDFDAGLAGISVIYTGMFNQRISQLIQYYSELQVDLVSIERLQEYMQAEQEPPALIPDRSPPAAWPTTAAIQVRNLEVRYTPDSDAVLHSISFDIRPHEKVGVVGRTGSGKSTLALSLFRLVDASSGSIVIDGINIHDIGLQDLRSKLTIIPQDAMLFAGTIRSNIDPFEEHTDTELWESLQRVHLAQCVQDTDESPADNTPAAASLRYPVKDLDQAVSDGGHNFSQGERQLLCMARALLRSSRLIIMDEATASVDFEMDTRLQKTIRQEFVDTTLICIAHRLRTVIDYDRILVLSHGKIVDYDTPHNLLSRPGPFRSMCENSGEIDILVDMAYQVSLQNGYTFKMADDHSITR